MELLETMRVEAGGAIPLLDRHLARIANSAQILGFLCHSAELRAAIKREAIKQKESVVFRLLLARDGSHELQVKPMPTNQITRLVLAPTRVNSADPMLRHKTTLKVQRSETALSCWAELDLGKPFISHAYTTYSGEPEAICECRLALV